MPAAIPVARERETIGGWLFLICILLVPHIVSSALILTHSIAFLRDTGADLNVRVESLRVITLVVMFLGHSSGLLLVLTRNQFAPAYFTIYIPLLLVLFLLDPDPSLTARTYAQRVGATYPEAPRGFIVHATISISVSALFLGYWLRSKRVQRTFGSNGIEIFRRARRVS